MTGGRRTQKTSRLENLMPRRLQLSIILAVILAASSLSLPASKDHKLSKPDKALLSGAISDLEGALSLLKQYAQQLKSNAEAAANEDEEEDPLAESSERESRDEDERQEPEIVPGLDRFEKHLIESKDEVRDKDQPIKPSSRDDISDISLQDLADFLREHAENKKKGSVNRVGEFEGKTTVKSTLASTALSHSKEISLNDLVNFLKEKQKEKSKGSSDEAHRTHAALDADRTEPKVGESEDPSLNEALEYLASLQKKLNNKSQ